MLRSGDGVGSGRIHHEAAVLGRRGQIHVIDPDAGPADDLEPPGGGLEDVAVDLGPAPDDERVAERDLGAELLGAEVVGAIDVGELLEEAQAGLAELLRDEDRRLRVHGEDDEAAGLVAAEGEAAEAEGGVEGAVAQARGGGGGRRELEGCRRS